MIVRDAEKQACFAAGSKGSAVNVSAYVIIRSNVHIVRMSRARLLIVTIGIAPVDATPAVATIIVELRIEWAAEPHAGTNQTLLIVPLCQCSGHPVPVTARAVEAK